MRRIDPTDDERRELTLFEQWMGMTPEEWEALGEVDDAADEQPSLL